MRIAYEHIVCLLVVVDDKMVVTNVDKYIVVTYVAASVRGHGSYTSIQYDVTEMIEFVSLRMLYQVI